MNRNKQSVLQLNHEGLGAMPISNHRRVIVTGGLGALGRSVAELLAERGARVALLDRAPGHDARGAELVLGGVDLTDPSAAARAFADAGQRLGGIDALVNVAGGFEWETLEAGSI